MTLVVLSREKKVRDFNNNSGEKSDAISITTSTVCPRDGRVGTTCFGQSIIFRGEHRKSVASACDVFLSRWRLYYKTQLTATPKPGE
jgi:hypothetical protein